MSINTERWNIILSEFSGWQTSRDSDDIPDGKSPDLLNVRLAGSHFRGAAGYELAGSRNTGAGEITSQYTYNRNDGKQIQVRVKDDGSTGTLEWYDATNERWYVLLASLTTGKIMGFAEFNTSTTNQMVFCNGVENMSVWTGAATRLTAAVSLHDIVISVADNSDFPASGTIIYNGTEIAYTSKTGTTILNVADAHASAGADDGVAQAADDSTHSAITKGNILVSAKDRLWIAGQPAEPSSVDYSDEGAAFTFSGGAIRTASGTEDIYNIGGRITGLAEKGEEIIFLGPDGAVGFKFVYPTDVTKAPVYREIFRTPGQGCVSSRSVCKVNNEVYFCNKYGIQSIADMEGSEKIFTKSISREILPTVKTYDFSEAAAVYSEKEHILLFACKTDADYPGNDVVIGVEFYQDDGGVSLTDILTGKQSGNRLALTRLDWPVNAFSILGDDVYFGSSVEMNSFKGFSTYQNDGAPRTIKYATKRFNFKNPFQEKGSRLAAVKGYIKDGTKINVQILYNAGFLGEQRKTVKSDGVYVSKQALNAIGAFELGTNPIGSSLEEVSELKDFMVYLDLGVDYTSRDIQLIFTSETDGGTFILTHVGFAVEEEGFASRDDLTI